MKIKCMANNLGYDVAGNSEENIIGINWYRDAFENQIAICHSKQEIAKTKAKVVLSDKYTINIGKTIVYTNEPIEVAVVRIIKFLIDEGLYKDYSKPDTLRVSEGSTAYGDEVHIGMDTVISPFCTIESGVTIGNNCIISSNVNIKRDTQIGNNVKIGSGSVIGADSFYHFIEDGKLTEFIGVAGTVIADNVSIGNNCDVQRGVLRNTIIDKSTHVGNLVDIGHDVIVGKNCKIVSQSGIASNVTIGNNVQIYGQVGISNNVGIGDNVTIMAKSLITKDIPNNKTVSGIYARKHSEELRIQARIRKLR